MKDEQKQRAAPNPETARARRFEAAGCISGTGDALAARGSAHQDLTQDDLASLAHELRTPLSAIVVLAEIMRDERLGPLGTPRYRGYAADIHNSAAHANSVLSGWLDQARTGDGAAATLDFVELDPVELVRGTVSALALLAERAGVALRDEAAEMLPRGLPRIIADRRSIQQILYNLLANALKFTPPGGVVVVRAVYSAGGPVVIEVIDNGDGMTVEELARAQSSASSPEPLRRRSGGTGIGLPLIRALAAACGAVFEIDSALGKGTQARIVFPHDRVVPV